MTRGLRNNNPLNIRHSADKWQGARINQTDKSFVQFETMAYGYRAAWKVLESYWKYFKKERKAYTVRNIIERWAPPNENDTEAYIRTLTMLTGLGGNESIPRPKRYKRFAELERTALLLAGMTCIECGIGMHEVDRDAIWEGYDLAFDNNRKRILKHEQALTAYDEYWEWSSKAFGE